MNDIITAASVGVQRIERRSPGGLRLIDQMRSVRFGGYPICTDVPRETWHLFLALLAEDASEPKSLAWLSRVMRANKALSDHMIATGNRFKRLRRGGFAWGIRHGYDDAVSWRETR